MKFNLSPEELQQGRMNQTKTKETPNSFSMEGGASVVKPTNDLSQGDPRKAGQMGERLIQVLNDPAEAQRTQNWMASFNMSPAALQNGWVAPPAPPEGEAPPQ